MAGDSAKEKRAVVAVLVGLAALAVVIGGLAAAGVFTDDGSGSTASATTVTTAAEASPTQPPGTTGVTPSSSGTATGDWVARAAAICAATGERLSGQIQPNPDNDPQIRADGWTLTGQALAQMDTELAAVAVPSSEAGRMRQMLTSWNGAGAALAAAAQASYVNDAGALSAAFGQFTAEHLDGARIAHDLGLDGCAAIGSSLSS